MNDRPNPNIDRREVLRSLRVLAIGAAAASTGACSPADAENFPNKRKAHYQAGSPDIQNFYRVNRYPAK